MRMPPSPRPLFNQVCPDNGGVDNFTDYINQKALMKKLTAASTAFDLGGPPFFLVMGCVCHAWCLLFVCVR
jgi:hypothetical protein